MHKFLFIKIYKLNTTLALYYVNKEDFLKKHEHKYFLPFKEHIKVYSNKTHYTHTQTPQL